MKKSKLAKSSQRIPSPIEGFVQKTEWTATAKIMEWINSIIKDKNLPIGISEVETKLKGEGKRPDIVIYRGRLDQEIICVLEFKSPFYESDDEENLKEPARKKATKRNSRYFATSNFQSLILFNTAKVNEMKPIEEQVVEKYSLSRLEDLNEIETPKFRNSIYLGLEKFLLDLTEFVTGKKPEPLIEINLLLVWRLQEKINRLAPHYKRIIEDECHKDREFRRQLKKWFTDQMWEFNAQEGDFVKAARQTAYLLINKIIFYYALQSKRQTQLDPLNIPDDLTKGGLLQKHLQNYFDYVLNEVDYETIYSADFIDSLAFPENEAVVTEIKNLVKILKRYNFSKLGFDIIGHIFEGLIPREERHNLGQYFTNPNIVDLILRFCLQHEKDKVLDPACGAGTFLVRAYQHKKLMNSSLTHEEIIDTLWGVDVAKFPAHLSTINLAINDLSVDKNYPNIVRQDFFNLHSSLEGLELPESWRKARAVSLGKTPKEITYPRWFDCIVGNPPYTRQEEISEISPEDKKYKTSLIQNALVDLRGRKIAEISKRAGIHAYFFTHGMKFLKNGGRFGFIVSSSWLDVDYGKGLQKFFLENYKIIAIAESKVERWFEDADINTCIVILEKCSNAPLRNENLVRFVYLKKPLSNFIPPVSDIWVRSKERIDRIDDLCKTILFHNEFYENEDLRIFPKKQKELWEEGFDPEQQKYVGAKWGKYLRAPEIFFKILQKGKDKFVPLKETAEVRRGFTTGANEFFYLTEDDIEKWGIEKEFWMHKDEKGNWVPNYVIRSGREAWSITVKPEKLKFVVLMVHKNKKDLKGKNVLDYIHRGERKGFHNRPTCANRVNWYDLGERNFGDFFYFYQMGDRFLVLYNKYKMYADCNLFDIYAKDKAQIKLLGGLLNTSLLRLLLEIQGRQLIGALTVLKVQVYELLQNFVVNPNTLLRDIQNRIEENFDRMAERGIGSIFSEIGAHSPEEVSLDKIKPDRRELDEVIMGDILGLTDEEQLEVYRAVVDLVKSRIEKAKSTEKRKKTKEGIDIELLVKSVLMRIGEGTLGKFYNEKILSQSCYEKNLPEMEGEIIVEKDLFKWRLSGDNAHIECESEIEASYLKNFVGTGLSTVRIPKDKKYLTHILPELEKTRQNIDAIIKEDVLSIISPKTQSRVLHTLWQEIMKNGN